MNHITVIHNNLPMSESTHYSPRYGCLPLGGVKAFNDLAGERIHCNSGHLWVTFEDDIHDYLLAAGESVEVPNAGRTLVSGPGCFRISRGIDGLDLAVAS